MPARLPRAASRPLHARRAHAAMCMQWHRKAALMLYQMLIPMPSAQLAVFLRGRGRTGQWPCGQQGQGGAGMQRERPHVRGDRCHFACSHARCQLVLATEGVSHAALTCSGVPCLQRWRACHPLISAAVYQGRGGRAGRGQSRLKPKQAPPRTYGLVLTQRNAP